jgi:hypothetical protein
MNDIVIEQPEIIVITGTIAENNIEVIVEDPDDISVVVSPEGFPGQKGDKGDQGLQGIQGVQGVPGVSGEFDGGGAATTYSPADIDIDSGGA